MLLFKNLIISLMDCFGYRLAMTAVLQAKENVIASEGEARSRKQFKRILNYKL
jgi:hypothetical protein